MSNDLVKRLRNQNHWHEDLYGESAEEIERLNKALRFAAGLISTYPPYDNSHPQDVYDWILREVDADD